MKCEKSVIVMTLFQLDYIVYNLDNYADTPTKTGLRINGDFWAPGVVKTNGRNGKHRS